MTKTPNLKAALAGLALLAAGGAAAQTAGMLKEPQAVPLDFLTLINKDVGWLQGQLTALGVTSPPEVRDGLLEVADLNTLKAANRIRAFAYLAAKGLRPPYYDLTVASATGPVRCITPFPYSVVPGLGPMDFAVASFSASAADPEILKQCTVNQVQGAPYDGLDRTTFRERFFDPSGVLKSEFQSMNADTGFMARAIDLGFFLGVEDYSGALRVDLQ